MKLVVKNLNEVNQFMEAVKPLVLRADISENNNKVFDEISGEIVLGDEDSQIKIPVTNDSITNSPDLPTKININKPEDKDYSVDFTTGYSVDFTKYVKKLFAESFDIGLSELDNRDNQ